MSTNVRWSYRQQASHCASRYSEGAIRKRSGGVLRGRAEAGAANAEGSTKEEGITLERSAATIRVRVRRCAWLARNIILERPAF